MPRDWTETVEPYLDLREGNWYLMSVLDVSKPRSSRVIRVVLEHHEGSQEGRCHTVDLQLPIHPQGRCADFLRACGFDVSLNAKITPRKVIGCTLAARFGRSTETCEWEIQAFKPAPKNAGLSPAEEESLFQQLSDTPASEKPPDHSEE